MSWFANRVKALLELGPQAVMLYAWHQVGLRSGWLRRQTPPGGWPASPDQLRLAEGLFPLPERAALQEILGEAGTVRLLAEADEIVAGQVRLFGGTPVPLQLASSATLQHWTWYEGGLRTTPPAAGEFAQDIKFTWEHGRFGWAIILARAYWVSGSDTYAQCFWEYTERFCAINPANMGPHWASAQEVALRLIALVFVSQVVQHSPQSTPRRRLKLAQALADHAARIPPSLAYARAQHNNHLVSEAAGLYTAGLALPDHPQAAHWRKLGWRWLNHALQTQISPSGAYSQHSTNYHRLVLQAAAWVNLLRGGQGQDWPELTRQRLSAATHWLLALCDPVSGQAPNLGPNDGALILPLAACPFSDYRPALEAAALAFVGGRAFPPGLWDESTLWLSGQTEAQPIVTPPANYPIDHEPYCLHSLDENSWATLRVAHFNSRPGHADQLHLDLWWQGLNLAQDPGTYLYNAAPPWDNSLTHTAVHNTLTVDDLEQMTRAGRFLYLDWAQAQVSGFEQDTDTSWQRITAQHDGYRKQGILHQRTVTASHDGRWLVEDVLLPSGSHHSPPARLHRARLHWLLPDWPWELALENDTSKLLMRSALGEIQLNIQSGSAPPSFSAALFRAGQALYGTLPASPILGWAAPTYGVKLPALSLVVEAVGELPLALTSEWMLP